MKPFYKVVVWFILAMATLNMAFSLINKASSVANYVGLAILFALIYFTDKTNFLTNIKNKKDEKNN